MGGGSEAIPATIKSKPHSQDWLCPKGVGEWLQQIVTQVQAGVIREEGSLSNGEREDYAIREDDGVRSGHAGRVHSDAARFCASFRPGGTEQTDRDCGEHAARWQGWRAARRAHRD